MRELKIGSTVKLRTGRVVEVVDKIQDRNLYAEYIVRYNKKRYLLKWYFENSIFKRDIFIKNIINTINKNSFQNEKILWPLGLAVEDGEEVGVIMNLPLDNYKKLFEVLEEYKEVKTNDGKTKDFISLDTTIEMGRNMVKIFNSLHRNGLFLEYADEDSFYVDIKTGDVIFTGAERMVEVYSGAHICGNVDYIAPEILNYIGNPDIQTDKQALAVFLFRLFFRIYPLEDKVYINLRENDFHCSVAAPYGRNLIFRYDTSHNYELLRNPQEVMATKLWKIYPQYLREAFTKAFTTGVENPQNRIIEKQWEKILERFRLDVANSNLNKLVFYK